MLLVLLSVGVIFSQEEQHVQKALSPKLIDFIKSPKKFVKQYQLARVQKALDEGKVDKAGGMLRSKLFMANHDDALAVVMGSEHAQKLLSKKSDLFFKGIHAAKVTKNNEKVDEWMQAMTTHRKWRPLHEAVRRGDTLVVEGLAKHAQSSGEKLESTLLSQRDENGHTALSYAALFNQPESAQILLDHGSDVDSKDSKGATPLYYAARTGNSKMVHLLLDRKADINLESKSDARFGLKPVDVAALHGHSDAVKMLQKASLNDSQYQGYANNVYPNMLHYIIQKGKMHALEQAFTHGVLDINGRYKPYNLTPLQYAIEYHKPEMVQFLLQHGARVSVRVLDFAKDYLDVDTYPKKSKAIKRLLGLPT